MEWIEANGVMIGLIWVATVSVLEVIKRAIPGTKDDNIIIWIVGVVSNLLSFTAAGRIAPTLDNTGK